MREGSENSPFDKPEGGGLDSDSQSQKGGLRGIFKRTPLFTNPLRSGDIAQNNREISNRYALKLAGFSLF